MTDTSAEKKLRPRQKTFIEAVMRALTSDNPDQRVITLAGPAGTGKSTAITEVLRDLAAGGFTCLVTAPTHKAVNVLNTMIAEKGIEGVKTATIHSALGIKPKKVPPGAPEEFTQVRKPDVNYDLIIVDEASMIGRSLLAIIQEHMIGRACVVFTGDLCQLRPVGELSKSAVFQPLFDEGSPYTHEIYKLITVVRHGGPVLELATKLRKSRFVPQIGPAEDEASRIIAYESTEEMTDAWISWLRKHPDTILLTYKNDNRRMFNDIARKRLFGEDVPDYRANDKVVTLNAWNPEEEDEDISWGGSKPTSKFIPNNTELTIVNAEFVEDFQPIPELSDSSFCFDSWHLVVNFNGRHIDCYALANHERSRFKKRTQALARDIKKAISSAQEMRAGKDQAMRNARRRWPTEFFPLLNFYIDIDFGYACTIHKSQGSTYEHVFIHDDYSTSRSEAVTLAYVAFSRAQKSVHHLDTRISKRRELEAA